MPDKLCPALHAHVLLANNIHMVGANDIVRLYYGWDVSAGPGVQHGVVEGTAVHVVPLRRCRLIYKASSTVPITTVR